MESKQQPDRYLGQPAGIVRRLRHARLSQEAAEKWVVAWEKEARARGLDPTSTDFWRTAWEWIAEQRGLR